MTIKHHATVLCDYLIRSDEGRISLVGQFQNIQANRLPCVKNPMGVYVAFEGSGGEPYEIVFCGPDGGEQVLEKGVVTPPTDLEDAQQWSVQVVGVLTPAVFRIPGRYSVVLRSEGERIHEYSFGVLPPRDEAENAP